MNTAERVVHFLRRRAGQYFCDDCIVQELRLSKPVTRMTDRSANAPDSPSDHQPVFHTLSTGLSTGCTRHCEEPTGPAFGGPDDRAKR